MEETKKTRGTFNEWIAQTATDFYRSIWDIRNYSEFATRPLGSAVKYLLVLVGILTLVASIDFAVRFFPRFNLFAAKVSADIEQVEIKDGTLSSPVAQPYTIEVNGIGSIVLDTTGTVKVPGTDQILVTAKNIVTPVSKMRVYGFENLKSAGVFSLKDAKLSCSEKQPVQFNIGGKTIVVDTSGNTEKPDVGQILFTQTQVVVPSGKDLYKYFPYEGIADIDFLKIEDGILSCSLPQPYKFYIQGLGSVVLDTAGTQTSPQPDEMLIGANKIQDFTYRRDNFKQVDDIVIDRVKIKDWTKTVRFAIIPLLATFDFLMQIVRKSFHILWLASFAFLYARSFGVSVVYRQCVVLSIYALTLPVCMVMAVNLFRLSVPGFFFLYFITSAVYVIVALSYLRKQQGAAQVEVVGPDDTDRE